MLSVDKTRYLADYILCFFYEVIPELCIAIDLIKYLESMLVVS